MAEQSLEYQVLSELSSARMPIGASYLTLRVNASQATIGRVLQEFEYKGLVEKASNKGRLLTRAGQDYFDRLCESLNSGQQAIELVSLITSRETPDLLDVLETRVLLEQHTVRLATQRAVPRQLAQLADILDRQAEQQSAGHLGEEENLEFHTAVAAIAGNKVIELLLELIMTQKQAYRRFSVLQYRVAERSTNDHFSIFRAIQSGDADQAAALMRRHLEALIDDARRIDGPAGTG